MSYKIKFGTDGWREIIARDYTVENVRRVALATAKWLNNSGLPKKAVIGFDCRFGGEMFMNATAEVFASEGIKCLVAESFVTTPMVSLATAKNNCGVGIVITASHNPPEYNGFKIKAHYGGPASPAEVQKIEDLISSESVIVSKSYADFLKEGIIEIVDLETLYFNQVESNFDMDGLRNGSLSFAYDAMYGAGQNIVRRLLPDATFLHCEHNPGFDGQAPEPIDKNLQEFSEMIEISENIDSGLATDGDADRIGLYNSSGLFVDSHHIILLLIHYLHKHKGLTGKVVTSFSCTGKIKKLCNLYGLEQQTTKIGFKYICDIMVADDVLIGGEESGGIAIKGHIPERDGVWIGLVIWEFMMKTGKTLDDLIEEIYELVGCFSVERYDLHISEQLKQSIVQKCKNNEFTKFGSYTVERIEDLDGFKFHLGNDQWVMIRPSGTEPVLRVYAEAASSDDAFAILDATKNEIGA
ncbi:MAG: phosphoglucomutase/phosphomannomutase family protein [Flavobacteriales bacterium]|nr:phosphoglucomutase/phosphomannomutase family protein [Flavobacteriales bacterium]